MALIKPEQLRSGSYEISGSFSGSFQGDGSQLTNLPIGATGSNGEIQFNDSGSFGADSGLVWDNTNKRLGVGTNTPNAQLQVLSSSALSTHNVATIGTLRVNGEGSVYNNGNSSNAGNSFFGIGAGRITTGGDNSFFGSSAGSDNTSGINNSFFGHISGRFNTTGVNNSFFGRQSGQNNTTGFQNSFFGSSAGQNNTTADTNSFFGALSGVANTTGRSNSFFGAQSGEFKSTGDFNTFIGRNAGRLISTGANLTIANNSLFLGFDTRAAANNETNQIVIGHQAIGLGSNTSVIGNTNTTLFRPYGNVAIGADTANARLDVRAQGALSTDSVLRVRNSADTEDLLVVNGVGDLYGKGLALGNLSFGFNSMRSNIGSFNVSIGENSMQNATNSVSNVSIGRQSLRDSIESNNNVSIGNNSGRANISGNNNVYCGANSAINLIAGENNVSIGHNAMRYVGNTLSSLSSATNSITIGKNAQLLNNNQTNQIVIGVESRGLGNNTTVIGNSSTTLFRPYGNVAIGADTAGARLDVRAQGALSTDIALRVRNSADTADLFKVTGDGRVGIGTDVPNTALEVAQSNNAFGLQMQVRNLFGGGNRIAGIGFSVTAALGITNYGFLGVIRESPNPSENSFVVGVKGGVGGGATLSDEKFRITSGGYVGIGTTNPQARLDVRAQGALSTDIALRVRNSADTADLFKVTGDGNVTAPTFTGSFIGDGSGLINVTASLAPNYVLTSSYLTDSASFDTRILSNSSSISILSGSYLTDSASFDTRILNNSSSIDLLSGSFIGFSGSYLTDSSSFDTRILTNSSSIATVSSNLSIFSGSYVLDSASFDTRIFTNSSSIDILSGSFETFTQTYNTGSFTGSFIGDGSQLTGIATTKWSGSNPITRDSNVEITGSFKVAGQTTLSTTGSGTLTVQGSGSAQPLFLVTGSVGELVSVIDDDDPNAPLLVVSGSAGQLFVVENSTTGSLLQIYNNDSDSVFEVNGNAEIVYGVSSSILATQYTTIPVTASYQTIYSIETGSFTGAFVNYTVVSASNARAGQLMSVWNFGTASFTEATTTDIGDTSQIAFDVVMTGSVAQIAVSASLTTGWQVKTALNIL
jgi:hypothetical protein